MDAWSPGGQVYKVLVEALEAITIPSAAQSDTEDQFTHFSGDPEDAPDRDRVFTLTLVTAPTRFDVDNRGCQAKQVTFSLQTQYVFSPPDPGEAGTAWEVRAIGDAELIEDALDNIVSTWLTPEQGQIKEVHMDGPPDTLYGGRLMVVAKPFTVVYTRIGSTLPVAPPAAQLLTNEQGVTLTNEQGIPLTTG